VSSKYALLVGVSAYDDPGLSKLEAPPDDIGALRAVLEDPTVGAFDRVVPLVDQPRDIVMDALHELYEDRAADDLVALYFSGHGVVDAGNRFFVAVAGTRLGRLRQTAVHYRDVHKLMDESPAKGQLVILDCCHAGAFADRARAAAGTTVLRDDVLGTAGRAVGAGEGRWILAATDATSYAFERDQLIASGDRPRLGVFTEALIEGLRTGAGPEDAEFVTSEALYAFAEARVRAEVPTMRPQRWVSEGSAPLRLARRASAPSLPQEVLDDLASANFRTRLGTILFVEQRVAADAKLAEAARRALGERLDVERDYEVRERLARAVEALKVGPGPGPLTIFRDVEAPWCPEMVAIPAGRFAMGSPPDEEGRWDDEGPQHAVSVPAFAIGRYPVTFAEYDHFCEVTGREKPDDRGWGRGRRPVINVSWEDAQAYLAWLSEATGKPYRLPSEAEWEYACRAGTTTPRYAEPLADIGWFRDNSDRRTHPVGEKAANAWGLHDTLGNVVEWCADHWHDSYEGAPSDGSAWIGDGAGRVVRGGSWDDGARLCRAACRFRLGPGNRLDGQGFRPARGQV